MIDLVIRGATVVTPEEVGKWDVAIQGDRIARIAPPGSLPTDVARVIDAEGKILVPGGIDPHVHTNWVTPATVDGKRFVNAPPRDVSQAALYGGTTVLVDFAIVEYDGSMEQSIKAKLATWADSYTDYSVHVLLHGGAPKAILEQVPETISAGFPSFKVFTTDCKPMRRGIMMKLGDIWELMQTVSARNGIIAVHAEDNDIVMHLYDKFTNAGDVSYKNLPAIHNAMSEDLSFRRIIRLAQYVDGAALYMMHVSAAAGVEAIAEARAAGYPIYGETLHNFTAFTATDYLRPDGVIFHTYPSIKQEKDRQRLWSGLLDGTLSTMATDESCTPRAVKLSALTIADTVGGHVGVETRLAIAFTEGVSKRAMPLQQFVAITSSNAAKLCGMYPQKGAIQEGSDADLVLMDPSVRRVLRASELHDSDYSIWDGWEVHGWPAITILRGKVVVEDGQMNAEAGYGKVVKRKMASEIQDRPAV